MNKHILFVMDHLANPDKYTQEQLKDNALAAYAYAAATTYAGAAAGAAAYRAAAGVVAAGVVADAAAAYAADVTAYAAAYRATAWAASVDYCLNEYFEESGENKDDYIMELTK
jgi:hypothetical protein